MESIAEGRITTFDDVGLKIAPDRTISDFNALYIGGLAQATRNAGDREAMPPWTQTHWFGKQVCKCPVDLWTFQEIICETKPDLLIETGTSGGGSAFFFATMFDCVRNGKVFTVDKDRYPEMWREHPRITYFQGDSANHRTAQDILINRELGLRTMVVLDALHTYEHVKAELELYAYLVTPGCYLVVEDTVAGLGAERAVAEFLGAHPEFTVDESREKHLLTMNRGGWLRRS